MSIQKVSIHGGHSGQFCNHAKDRLEDIVKAYIEKEFTWVGLTEHMPPPDNAFRYPDEIEAGLNYRDLQERFDEYMNTARVLQKKYADQIDILVGFETESYTGSAPYIQSLIKTYTPDYVVGSVHHVDDINFDFSPEAYEKAINHMGGIIELYNAYFDVQYEMIKDISPQVVGHIDLIRIFDQFCDTHFNHPDCLNQIHRNMLLIQSEQIILDINLRAMMKPSQKPYVNSLILEKARMLEIPVVPGDDSHGVDTVGLNFEIGVQLLEKYNINTNWQRPDQRPSKKGQE